MQQDLRPPAVYVLPPELRRDLARPFGPVFSTAQLAAHLKPTDRVVAVGDVVSLTCRRMGVTPRLIVVDFRTERGEPSEHYRRELGGWGMEEHRVHNPAGTITAAAWDAVRAAMRYTGPGPVRIVVDGEEDLLGIPCFLEAPPGTKVLYGSPGQGVVVVKVEPALQERVAQLLARFEKA